MLCPQTGAFEVLPSVKVWMARVGICLPRGNVVVYSAVTSACETSSASGPQGGSAQGQKFCDYHDYHHWFVHFSAVEFSGGAHIAELPPSDFLGCAVVFGAIMCANAAVALLESAMTMCLTARAQLLMCPCCMPLQVSVCRTSLGLICLTRMPS